MLHVYYAASAHAHVWWDPPKLMQGNRAGQYVTKVEHTVLELVSSRSQICEI